MTDADDIIAAIKAIITEIAPNTRYVAKYGGEVLATDPDSDTSFVGGIFAYKDHVSLEFSEGAGLDDPAGHLEGKGKKRRHLKLETVADVDGKQVKSYLTQVL